MRNILRGWHITAIIGVLSSTAVAARLGHLGNDALQRACGLAASQMRGLVRATVPARAAPVANSSMEGVKV